MALLVNFPYYQGTVEVTAQATATLIFAPEGTPLEADSAKYGDPTNTYGVVRTDTEEVVVEAGINLTYAGDGIYQIAFTGVPGARYEWYAKLVYDSSDFYYSGEVRVPFDTFYPNNLYGIRKQLIDDSGKYELVVDPELGDYTDKGANRLIHAAQDWLDNKFDYHKQDAWLYQKLSEGETFVSFQNARFIKEVWLYDVDRLHYLDRVDPLPLRLAYPEEAELLKRGRPRHWAPTPIGLAPQQAHKTKAEMETEGYKYLDWIRFGAHYSWRGIMMFPPADQDYTLAIRAAFHSGKLVQDTDENFWTVAAPALLVRAARRQMEIDLHRNRSGVADFEEPLLRDLMDLSFNLTAEEVSGPAEDYFVRG